MSLALRNKQLFALCVLALVTVIILSLVTYATVAHVNLLHMLFSWGGNQPNMIYPHN